MTKFRPPSSINLKAGFCYNELYFYIYGFKGDVRLKRGVLSLSLILSATLALAGCSMLSGRDSSETTVKPILSSEIAEIEATSDETPTPSPSPTMTSTPTPTPAPEHISCSFIGDCTLAEALAWNGDRSGFDAVVNYDYNYCFQNAVSYLSQDDMTLANFEGTLTDATSHLTKEFVFGSPAEYAQMLVNGSIECVNLSNNHSYDYLQEGLDDTRENLESYGILWSDKTHYAIYEVRGIRIGMCGVDNVSGDSISEIYPLIDQMRNEENCNIIIVSCHWGIERYYEPTNDQVATAHALIDYGVDLVVGTHPHRLQPIEEYNGKYIFYSLSNFCFGGNTGLSDPDSCIIQCEFVMDATNTYVEDYIINVVPFSQTSYTANDYCPRPYAWWSTDYNRVLNRLNWHRLDE